MDILFVTVRKHHPVGSPPAPSVTTLGIKKNMFKISTLLTILLCGMLGANAAILTATTTADAGFASLRRAIDDAITNGAANNIVFAIPITDPGYNLATNRFTILLASTLPTIPVSATNITNTQPQALTVRGDDTFRILSLVNSA